MRLVLALLLTLTAAAPLWAACDGEDLFLALPQKDRAALRAAAAAQPHPEGLTWRATRGADLVHLVGTMHFHEPRHQATFDRIAPWLDAAAVVLLELGDGDEARLQAEITANPSLAFIMEGPTLPELLPQADWDRLRAAFAERGVPGFMAAKMRPWMAMLSLGLTKCVLEDVSAGRPGLDQMIAAAAAAQGKPARALEPYDTAMRLFESYSQDEMLQFLRLFLQIEGYDPDSQHVTLVEAYFREEIRVIWEYSIAQSLAQPQGMTEAEIRAEYVRLEQALIAQRNRAWIPRILTALQEGPVLVAAGALHLPGDVGVLALLEAEGFTVERVPPQ